MDDNVYDLDLDEKQEAYLEALLDGTPTIKHAAEKAGVHPLTPFKWRRNVEGFAELEDTCRHLSSDDLVQRIHEFALNGVETEITIAGHPVFAKNPDGSLLLDDDFNPVPLIKREHKVEYAKLALQAGGRIGNGSERLTIDQQKGDDGQPDHFRITLVRAENGRPARD